mmetsp:Transcript_9511/g.38829  ORF Transcript_9511/g.38829 Transcript_9511/m.38829 type:complete len:277 (-) Transcript_9511:28-858(-)
MNSTTQLILWIDCLATYVVTTKPEKGGFSLEDDTISPPLISPQFAPQLQSRHLIFCNLLKRFQVHVGLSVIGLKHTTMFLHVTKPVRYHEFPRVGSTRASVYLMGTMNVFIKRVHPQAMLETPSSQGTTAYTSCHILGIDPQSNQPLPNMTYPIEVKAYSLLYSFISKVANKSHLTPQTYVIYACESVQPSEDMKLTALFPKGTSPVVMTGGEYDEGHLHVRNVDTKYSSIIYTFGEPYQYEQRPTFKVTFKGHKGFRWIVIAIASPKSKTKSLKD